jgi:outer membrane protein TolC
MKQFLTFILTVLTFSLSAQDDVLEQKEVKDTTLNTLTFDEFIQLVVEEHPLAMQANLQGEIAEAEMRMAKGFFDPKVYADVAQKYYEDEKYYSLAKGGVKVPTWFGLVVEGGYKQNEGYYLNPQNRVPENGLYFAGVSVPLGNGLLLDQRRAALRSAQIFSESTTAMQNALINEVFLNAADAYWEWFKAYHQREVYREAVEVADIRLKAVKQSAALGDRPSIDTLEAGIQKQNRQLSLQDANLNYQNAMAQLNVFLWADGLVPLEIEENTQPTSLDSIEIKAAEANLLLQKDSLINQHPLLQLSRFELQQLEVDRRLKAEQLKPTLNLKYQPIVEGVADEAMENFNTNNYEWGLEFSFPVFLRKQRGAIQRAKLKIQEKQFDLENKAQELRFKATSSFNEWDNSFNQVNLYQKTTNDYFDLLEGERNLFQIGESSLFLVNRRELGYINAQNKLIELISKNKKARAKAYYSLGIIIP